MASRIQADHDYSVKAVKSFDTHDGYAWNGNVYKGTKKIATAYHRGDGGEPRVDFKNPADRKEMEVLVATLPEIKPDNPNLPGEYTFRMKNAEDFIEQLVEDELERQHWKKQCRNKTLVEISSPDGGKPIFSYDRRYSPEFAVKIREKFGSRLIRIINEEL